MPLSLDDFGVRETPVPAPQAPVQPPAAVESERVAAYEQGYKAGWDDAARAEAENQSRIGAEFARNLQEMSFTFHEARAHVIQAMEPLLLELVGKLLPELVAETLGARILEELRPLVEDRADGPIQVVIAPANRAALERQLEGAGAGAFRLVEEPSLAEGQAYLRVGSAERQVDIAGALERISTAIRSLYDLNERTLKHA